DQPQATDDDHTAEQAEEQPADSDQLAQQSAQESDDKSNTSDGDSEGAQQDFDAFSTTKLARAEAEGGGVAALGGGSGGTTLSPFPQKLPDPLNVGSGFSNALQIALNHSIVGDGAADKGVIDDPRFSGLPDPRQIPITIVALDGSGQAAGQNEFDMYYSGSLLKVAAMYAAHQLRIAVNDLAAALPIDPASDATATTNLFNTIRATFDNEIANKVTLLPAAIDRALRVPKYDTIFKATRPPGGRFTLEFTTGGHSADPEHVPSDTFEPNLFDMIVGSHNASAGFCIRNLGYGWINGLLESA